MSYDFSALDQAVAGLKKYVASLEAQPTPAPAPTPVPAPTPEPTPIPAPTVKPARITSGQKVILAGRSWVVQSPDKTYSMAVDAGDPPNYLRMEMRPDDKWLAGDGRPRCELNSAPTAMPWGQSVVMVYSFRQTGRLPTSWTLMNQWHQRPDTQDDPGKSPCLGVQFLDGDIKIYTRGDPAPATTTDRPSTDRFRRPWDDSEGRWHHLVLNPTFHWSNGALKAWLDGEPVVSATGISLGYNDPYGPSPKLGIYRQNAPVTTIMEYANVEIGGIALLDRIAHPLPLPAV